VNEPLHRPQEFEARSLDDEAPSARSPFVPMLLVALSVSGWFGFQTLQLVREQQQLEAAKVSLGLQELAATRLRTALDQVATATAKLAAEGNGNARLIVEQLRTRGVTINPAGAASGPR
jgi:nitrogen fixation/metabolism regulation signal transduction histidine kinase